MAEKSDQILSNTILAKIGDPQNSARIVLEGIFPGLGDGRKMLTFRHRRAFSQKADQNQFCRTTHSGTSIFGILQTSKNSSKTSNVAKSSNRRQYLHVAYFSSTHFRCEWSKVEVAEKFNTHFAVQNNKLFSQLFLDLVMAEKSDQNRANTILAKVEKSSISARIVLEGIFPGLGDGGKK
jgi:hypothetical protein